MLKDINFVDIQTDLKRSLFSCKSKEREGILSILEADSVFLMKHNIMDYSLLLVIEEAGMMTLLNPSIIQREDTRNKYGGQHLGIIDYLQTYNSSKKAETWWKTRVLCKNPKLLSSVTPAVYQQRFYSFMQEHVFPAEREDYKSML